jgi:hypothetical protein
VSGAFLALIIADLTGAATLWLVTRAGRRHAWAWSLAAWVAIASVGLGIIRFGTVVQVAALMLVLGVGMITPIVGLLAALMLIASPVLIAHQLWGWWRRRIVDARISRA